MVVEFQKYRAQMFQISGLSCFSPLGKIFLDLKDLDKNNLTISFGIHLLVSLVLCYIGIFLLNRGFKILKKYSEE